MGGGRVAARAGRVETEFRKSSKKPEAVSCCYAATIDHLGGRRERERVRRRASPRPRTRLRRVSRAASFARRPMAVPCRARVTRRANRYRQRSTTSRRLRVAYREIHRDSRIDCLTLIDRLPVPSRSGSWPLLLPLRLFFSGSRRSRFVPPPHRTDRDTLARIIPLHCFPLSTDRRQGIVAPCHPVSS